VRPVLGRLRELQDALDALARRHDVPGAVLAVGAGDETHDFATGVLSIDTGVATTTDSVFQIGSNTKLYTVTLLMQLVDEGKVDLDAPVRKYLPRFTLRDAAAARAITVRHLVTHTSGIEGDHFEAFGRGDDAIERYVDSLAGIGSIHPPGAQWSYCNSGFVVAGRVAEVVGGAPFHQLLRERVCAPLGLRRTTLLAEEMVGLRCAVGHVTGAGGKLVVPPVVVLSYSHAPGGSVTVATGEELVRFVRMHLRAADGAGGVISRGSASAMQRAEVARPTTIDGSKESQGLGWMIEEWDGRRVIGHGGGTIGQMSYLHAVPDEELVVVLLTNSVNGGKLWRTLGPWVFDELAGIRMPKPPRAAEPPPRLTLSRYAGTYERLDVRSVVTVEGDGLSVQTTLSGVFAELNNLTELPPVHFRPVDAARFVAGDDILVFLDFEKGRPGYAFDGGRVARRRRR
jgi:CubicO group peptidase (beta-lactamase class C family)